MSAAKGADATNGATNSGSTSSGSTSGSTNSGATNSGATNSGATGSDTTSIDANLEGKTVLFAHPSGELYGSDRVLVESVAGVVRAGGRAVVTLPVQGPLEDALVAVGAEVVLCETPVLRKSMLRPRGMMALLKALVSGSRSGRAVLADVSPDVVYVNTVTIPLWIALGRLSGVPVLAHLHEAEGSAPRPVIFLLNLPLLFATRVIANSRYSVSVLSRSFPRLARRTQIVYNGVIGPVEPTEARSTLENGLRVLYMGRLSDRKGVDVLVDALATLRDRNVPATLDIVGAVYPGYEWYENHLRYQVSLHELDDRVRMHGFDSDIWPHVSEADVVVVPSRFDEPFGNTAVEALLGARAVIVSNTSGLREAAGGYLTSRAVPPNDPVALADSLIDVIEHWSAVPSDAQLDRVRAISRHSPQLYQQRIAHIMLDLTPAKTQITSGSHYPHVSSGERVLHTAPLDATRSTN